MADPRILPLIRALREIHCQRCDTFKLNDAEAIELVMDCIKDVVAERKNYGLAESNSSAGGPKLRAAMWAACYQINGRCDHCPGGDGGWCEWSQSYQATQS